MKRLFLILCSAVLVTGCSQSSSYKLSPWKVGQWVEYRVTPPGEAAPQGAGSTRIRYSLVGDYQAEGIKYFWFETYGTVDTSNFIFKMMVPERFTGQARRVIIKLGNEPAYEMPNELLESPTEYQPKLYSETEILAKKISNEKVTVPAGDFRCIHSKIGDAEVWVSSQIPVLGIVKYETATEKMELSAWGGSGAQTRITELPERLDLNKIFPQGKNPGQ